MFGSVTHPRKRAFLHAYAITGSVKVAAAEAGVKRETHYAWKTGDLDYAEAFVHATAMAADALIDEAKRRAQFGVKDFILYQGRIVMREVVDDDGVVTRVPLMKRKYSDTLLQFLIENLAPGFTPKREIAHSTPEPLKVEVASRIDLSHLSDEELALLDRIGSKLATPSGGGGDSAAEDPEGGPEN